MFKENREKRTLKDKIVEMLNSIRLCSNIVHKHGRYARKYILETVKNPIAVLHFTFLYVLIMILKKNIIICEPHSLILNLTDDLFFT